jgi:hypothetical protein
MHSLEWPPSRPRISQSGASTRALRAKLNNLEMAESVETKFEPLETYINRLLIENDKFSAKNTIKAYKPKQKEWKVWCPSASRRGIWTDRARIGVSGGNLARYLQAGLHSTSLDTTYRLT